MAYISYRATEQTWTPARARGREQAHERAEGMRAALAQAIEAAVVPRLVLAHRPVPVPIPEPWQGLPAGEVEKFAEVCLTADLDRACAHVQGLRDQGQRLETIYLELLAPAAAHLRKLWHDDLCDFAAMTLALWRLQQILVPAPGERNELAHVMFGLVMLSEFLRRDGWEAWLEPDSSNQEFRGLVQNQWFDVVELLVSGDRKLDLLAERIRMIRRESANRGIGVTVCGPAFVEHPELVLLVGADVMVNDPRQGALQARKVIGLLADNR